MVYLGELSLWDKLRKLVGPEQSTKQAGRDLAIMLKQINELPKADQDMALKFLASMYDLNYIVGGNIGVSPRLQGGLARNGGWCPDGEDFTTTASIADSVVFASPAYFVIIGSFGLINAQSMYCLNAAKTFSHYVHVVNGVNTPGTGVPQQIIYGTLTINATADNTGRVIVQKMKWSAGP